MERDETRCPSMGLHLNSNGVWRSIDRVLEQARQGTFLQQGGTENDDTLGTCVSPPKAILLGDS